MPSVDLVEDVIGRIAGKTGVMITRDDPVWVVADICLATIEAELERRDLHDEARQAAMEKEVNSMIVRYSTAYSEALGNAVHQLVETTALPRLQEATTAVQSASQFFRHWPIYLAVCTIGSGLAGGVVTWLMTRS